MLALIQQYRLLLLGLAVAALMTLSAAVAWQWQAWRYEAKIAKAEAAISAERVEAMRMVLTEQDASAARMAAADTKFTGELTDAKGKITELERRVAAGAGGLRVAAKCPASGSLPEAGTVAGVGDRGEQAAELDPAARPHYFALRRGIVELESALRACVNGR